MSSDADCLSLESAPPRDPVVSRVPFFYGWVMLPIAILGQIATSPGQTYGISVFNDYFRKDLQLSHTGLTAAYMLGTLLAALPVSLVGGWMDRYGIRRVMIVVVLLLGGACIGVSQVTGVFTLFLAFFALRMLGQGALSLLANNTLAMWFHARLGTASGIKSLGTAAAFAIIPPANLFLIQQFGWRTAYAILGMVIWAVMLPLLALFYRNRPEDVGQFPDKSGGTDASASQTPPPGNVHVHRTMTLDEAVRTRAYWILLVIHVAWALVGTAIIFHIVTLFAEYGLNKESAALFFTIFAVSMAAMQFAGGLLADRLRLHVLLSIAMGLMTFSVFYFLSVRTPSSAHVFAIALGGGQGLFLVLGQTIWARYYGRTHLGKIRGTVWSACVAGSSVGPFLMGVTKDWCERYTPALWVFATVYAALTLAALFARAPRTASR